MGRYHSNNTPKNHKEATVRDVIMGRGKRVSEWPGNIFFRQVINQQRHAYAEAQRSEKVNVAMNVIKKIEQNKGRFMTEQANGNWVEIEYARAVEKCCQALREKEKPNPPNGDPFSPPAALLKKSPSQQSSPETIPSAAAASSSSRLPANKRRKLAASTASSRGGGADKKASAASRRSTAASGRRGGGARGAQGRAAAASKARAGDSSQDDASSSAASSSSSENDSDDSSSSSSDDSSSSSESESGVEDVVIPSNSRSNRTKKPEAIMADSPVNLARNCNAEEMIGRLQAFCQEHGHCAVPPEWSKDPLLADWCTIQRQTRRIIQTGYDMRTTTSGEGRTAAAAETATAAATREHTSNKALLERLEKLHFVWDYDEWHWGHQFNQLVASQREATEKQSEQVNPSSLYWLEDQRRQYVESKANARPERTAKLQQAGMSLT